jgi:hypothetical protein
MMCAVIVRDEIVKHTFRIPICCRNLGGNEEKWFQYQPSSRPWIGLIVVFFGLA